jgi:hypothetical protein
MFISRIMFYPAPGFHMTAGGLIHFNISINAGIAPYGFGRMRRRCTLINSPCIKNEHYPDPYSCFPPNNQLVIKRHVFYDNSLRWISTRFQP